MQIGDHVVEVADLGGESRRLPGKVIYINRKYGWYMVEFPLEHWVHRECYFIKKIDPNAPKAIKENIFDVIREAKRNEL